MKKLSLNNEKSYKETNSILKNTNMKNRLPGTDAISSVAIRFTVWALTAVMRRQKNLI
jgi:hypothetical protein